MTGTTRPTESGILRARTFGVLVLVAVGALVPPLCPLLADDGQTADWLKSQGAKVVLTKGLVTRLEVADCSKWSEDDFRKVGGLAGLRDFSVGPGLTDQALALLSTLPALEVLQTNQSQFTDDGLKSLARIRTLKIVKFFHPGKAFTGAGLAHLAELPALDRLTVAGSLSFGDAGMAAAAKLVHLKELRTWHAGQTIEGVKRLGELKELKSLTLGQRLAYEPPTTLSNDTLAVLADLKSLESLRLEEARLSLDALLKLKQLPGLKTLVLEGIDMPEGDVDRLKTELPNTAIQWTKPNDTYKRRIDKLFAR